MEYTIYKETIQSPPKALSGYDSSFQIFRSDFNYCYETPS
jgi:hypothetical protein